MSRRLQNHSDREKEVAIPDRGKKILTSSWFLLALLALQCLGYWTLAVYNAGQDVPVAYQKF
jgi:hypothetical protein